MLRNFFNRLREPSSLAGVAVLATLFGADAAKANIIAELAATVLAAGAILIPERPKAAPGEGA